MAKELYVGSLSYQATEYDVEKLFSVIGKVTSIHLITDPKTGEFKGCGYVRMSTEAELKAALELDGTLLIDRTITVSIANPQKMRPQGGGKPFTPSRPKAKSGASSQQKPGTTSKPASATASKPASAAKPSRSSAPSGTSRAGISKSGTSRTASASRGGGAKPGGSRPGKR